MLAEKNFFSDTILDVTIIYKGEPVDLYCVAVKIKVART